MKIVDLSQSIYEGMFTVATHWHPVTEITILGRYCVEGRASRKIVLGSHTGTHVDAPCHFIPGGDSIDKVDLNNLVGNATVLDVSHRKGGKAISVDDVKDAAKSLELAPRVLIYTGWGDKAWDKLNYSSERPFITLEAAEWLVSQGAILLGIDCPDLEDPKEFKFGALSPMHVYLFENNVIIIENLCNLGQINGKCFTLAALPLSIKDSDGSPARVIAIMT